LSGNYIRENLRRLVRKADKTLAELRNLQFQTYLEKPKGIRNPADAGCNSEKAKYSNTPDSALSYSRRKDDDEGSDSTELAEVLPAIALREGGRTKAQQVSG